jgi:glycosyltransferase involved in cell wall biosynthesis
MKKFKVIGVPWHTGHQYELAKLPFIEEYALMINPWRYWGDVQRPMPPNMHYVTHYEKGYYDFAILHIDQQSIYDPDHDDRISKGRLYNELNECIQDIPKIVINHMTPFHDKYDPPYVINFIKKMVGNNTMVVNSYEAAKQWGWGNPIIHGLDTEEWKTLPKEPRAVVALSQAGMEKAYRRIFLHTVMRLLKDMQVPFFWIGVDKRFNNFLDYREFLGRSLVYFNPTWQSPRPRSRTEAMLSGCCVVTTPYQDADTFIKNGENGFLTSMEQIRDPRVMDNPKFAADLIKMLVLDKPELAMKIGEAGRQTAISLFNKEKFWKQWEDLLRKEGIWK